MYSPAHRRPMRRALNRNQSMRGRSSRATTALTNPGWRFDELCGEVTHHQSAQCVSLEQFGSLTGGARWAEIRKRVIIEVTSSQWRRHGITRSSREVAKMRGGGSRRGGVVLRLPWQKTGCNRTTRVRLETHTEVKTRFQSAHEEIDCRRKRPWASAHATRFAATFIYKDRADSNEENRGLVRAAVGVRGET